MIPEPQRTYVLELLPALGPAARELVIAGAQAIKFAVKDARGTKDVDFILDVIALRAEPLQLNAVLKQLGYTGVIQAANRLPRGCAARDSRPRLYRRNHRPRRVG